MHTRHLLMTAVLGLSTAMTAPAYAADPAQLKQSIVEYTSDTAITTKLKAALLGHKLLSAPAIQVETNKGVVTLTGTVATPQQREAARQAALGVQGVTKVTNHLRVDPLNEQR